MTVTAAQFQKWVEESCAGDVVELKNRFTWIKKVILMVDDAWMYFHDGKMKKSSLKPDLIRPVMMPVHPVVKEFRRLPDEQKIVLREALNLAGLAAFAGTGETINDAFLRLVKSDKNANYKAKQVAFNLVAMDKVELALDMTIEAREMYKKDKALLDSVEKEISDYFRPKGWIKKEIHYQQEWWCKPVTKGNIKYCDYALHGIEKDTNRYIHVKGTYDLNDKEIADDVATYFESFAALKSFIEVKE